MKSVARLLLGKLGYRIEGTRLTPHHLYDPGCLRTLEFDDVICRRMIEGGEALTFVQVGAFDGVTHDPLRKYISRFAWRGVFVEPQAAAAASLRELYRGNDAVVVTQAAIDADACVRTLFTVPAGAAPAWTGGLASFDRETIAKHAAFYPGLAELVREELVSCVTFETILDQLLGESLDILQIDAEGADQYLLSIFPFHRVKPWIIHWEIKHATKPQRETCFGRLIDMGYRLAPSGAEDMLAVLA